MTAADPVRYLTAADEMLRGAGPAGARAIAGGWWPKACACLIRLALERGLQEFWQRESPPVAATTNSRTRLLMLRRRVDRDTARRASYAWATLSRATHHHCYETVPTAAELRGLHREVTELLVRLAKPTASPVET
jgi:hypothetical protein